MTAADGAGGTSPAGIDARLRSAGLPALPRTAWLEVDLERLAGNIAAIRTDVDAVTYDADIKEADLQLIDATLTLCDDTLAGKNAGAETTEGGQ